MQVILQGEPKEIAALVLAVQERQDGIRDPLDAVQKSFQKAIGGIAQEKQTAL